MPIKCRCYFTYIATNDTHLISFQILINDSFSRESITNQSNTTYTIQPDPGQPPITETSTSNIVITNFVQAQLTITKHPIQQL